MVVRSEQLAALSQASSDSFADRLREHLLRCFPKECERLGPAGLDEFIQTGRDRATRYDITTRVDTCRYLDIMMVLGRDFDTDASLPRAKEMRSVLGLKPPDMDVLCRLASGSARERQRESARSESARSV